MIYTHLTRLAMKIAYDAHKDQTDLSGVPYVFHPYHLAEQMDDEKSTIIALLHDVVEDSRYDFEDLSIFGFSSDIINTLKLLTRNKDVPYEEYIKNLLSDPYAVKVKTADLIHNSDKTRCPNEISKTEKLRLKYKAALEYLQSCTQQLNQ